MNRSLKLTFIGMALISMSAQHALALDGVLKSFGGSSVVIVWKSVDARREGQSIVEAGGAQENIELLLPLVSCIASPGTKVIVTDAGFATHDVMIIQGDNRGCRGNIAMEELDTR